MIVHLVGKLLEKHPDHIVLDVHGVGYQVWITLNTYGIVGNTGDEVSILTYHQVREDSQDLFGFSHAEEREVFKHLISISGIGAKTALAILSGAQPDEFRKSVQDGNEEALTAIRGIGPKMARRILTELGDKFGAELPGWEAMPAHLSHQDNPMNQAVDSLVALGYKYHEAREAVRTAMKHMAPESPVEDLIRAALSAK